MRTSSKRNAVGITSAATATRMIREVQAQVGSSHDSLLVSFIAGYALTVLVCGGVALSAWDDDTLALIAGFHITLGLLCLGVALLRSRTK